MTKPSTISHWVATTPERVWEAYTTPELCHQFFSPEGLSVPLESVVIEMRVGGRFELDMVFDDTGVVNENKGIITDLDYPQTMAFIEPSMGISSKQTFVVEGGGTLITVVQEGLSPEYVDNPDVVEAFRSSFRKLGQVLGVATENR